MFQSISWLINTASFYIDIISLYTYVRTYVHRDILYKNKLKSYAICVHYAPVISYRFMANYIYHLVVLSTRLYVAGMCVSLTARSHRWLLYYLQEIKFEIKEFKFDETQTCSRNQLIIYEGNIADDTNRQEYCREEDIKTIQYQTFSAKSGIGFRFWSERTKTIISLKICYEFSSEYSIYNTFYAAWNDVFLNSGLWLS